MTWCKNPDRGLPNPDVVFYLEISISDAQQRGSFGKERYEKVEFQEKVADIYKQLRSDDWKVSTVSSQHMKPVLQPPSLKDFFLSWRAAVTQATIDKDMV